MRNSPKTWTDAELAELRQLYPDNTIPVDDLAQRFGCSYHVIYRKCIKLQIRRPVARGRGELTARIMAEAAKPGGCHRTAIEGYTPHRVWTRAQALVGMGLLFKATAYHNIRYFTTEAAAKAAQAVIVIKTTKKQAAAARAGWGPSDPVRITSATKVTIAPTPPRALYSNTHSRY